MKQFKSINGTVINLVNKWSEITVKQLVGLDKLNKDRDSNSELEQILFILDLLYVLTDLDKEIIDELEISLLYDMLEELNKDILKNTPVYKNNKKIMIGDKLYGFRDPNKLSIGEVVSYKEIEKRYPGIDSIPYLLAILCRPAKEVLNEETKKLEIIVDKFNANDLEFRKDIMLEQPAVDLFGSVNFFLSGKKQSTKSIKGYTKKVK